MTITPLVAAESEISFNRDIRPILSDKCYFCHGPDEAERQAGLRLDDREAAKDHLEGGDVLERITSDDPDSVMPPPDSKLTLTATEKELLARWLEEGAPYAKHWAFEPPPEQVAVPESQNHSWATQTFDSFVIAKIESAGLQPSPPAPPLRWLRRAALDLTGLPPSPDLIQRFMEACERDPAAAKQAAADELLASPAFGEHIAVSWLDAARYADSYGYQSDQLNGQWPYRDWVIRAFNSNLPYNEFLTWQLAGDLLPDATSDQKLATAFNRLHRLTNEGGAVFEEWRQENVADRVHTFGTAVLGLTLECSRCHDHKYDPISMREYYSLGAFFNSIDESGVYDAAIKVPSPTMLLPTDDQQAQIDAASKTLEDAKANYQKTLAEAQDRYNAWLKLRDGSQNEAADNAIADLKLAIGFDRLWSEDLKEKYRGSTDMRSAATMPESLIISDSTLPMIAGTALVDPPTAHDKPAASETEPADASAEATIQTVEPQNDGQPVVRRALRFDGDIGVWIENVEPFDRWSPLTIAISLRDETYTPLRRTILRHTQGTDCGPNGWDLTIVDGYLEQRLYRVWPGNAIGVRSTERLPLGRWLSVAAVYDGSSTAAGLKIYIDGRELPTTILRDKMLKSASVAGPYGGGFVLGQQFRDRGFDGGLVDDLRVFDRNLTPPEIRSLATGQAVEPTLEYFQSALDPASRQAHRDMLQALQAYVQAEEASLEMPIMCELANPRETHLLARGQYDAPKNDTTRVHRDVLRAIGLAMPPDAPRDRLGLARWVTDPRHPLTSRVAVNRLWANFFAEPLVRTPENFGLQGELPTHPELLDWLARDFVESGWDVKRMCRNIVLSATYGQDSQLTEETLELDPTNRLLARGPAYRLPAEQIRDVALAAAGLLDETSGGPPVSPYQPGEDLWRESNSMSPPYKQAVGRDLYRRSLYSVWKRTSPLPNMLAFDATPREVCTVRRSRTNTPLQALVLLNDVQFVEAARMLAEETLQPDKPAASIDQAFLRLAGRPADQTERQTLVAYFDQQRQLFEEHPDRAKELLQTGESPIDASLPPADLAAMTLICQVVLNLDSTVWSR